MIESLVKLMKMKVLGQRSRQKKNLPNGIIKGDSNVVPKTKVLPRNAEPGSSTNRDDGVRAEGLLKETVSKSREKINI